MKRKRTERSAEVMDIISGLPDHLIHSIVSSLPTKEATRTSALSKRFRSAWSSFPLLDFDTTYSNNWDTIPGKDRFFEYMHDCIQRRPDSGLVKFRLNVHAILGGQIDRANEAIAYAIANRVRELDVSCLNSLGCGYVLPPALFRAVFSANSLRVLRLNGFDLESLDHVNFPSIEELILGFCDMGNMLKVSSNSLKILDLMCCVGLSRIDISSSNLTSFSYQLKQSSGACEIHLIGCKSLKNLILKGVSITSECLKANVSKLIQLENLKLYCCDKLEAVCISSPSLKSLEISGCPNLKSIVVLAVNLESFLFEAHNMRRECDVDILECKLLKVLHIFNANITDKWVERTVSRLRFLEHLKLFACGLLKSIMVYHRSLKRLELIKCYKLREVQFHAKNLTVFKYIGEVIRSKLLIDASGLEADLTMHDVFRGGVLYKELRDFLSLFDHCKSLSIACRSIKYLFFPKDMRECLLPPLYDIKNLNIVSWSALPNLIEFVDSVLWLSPLVENLTFGAPFGPKKTLKLEYVNTDAFGSEEEAILGEEDILCCHKRIIKCWRHFVKKVSMKNFKASEERRLRKYFTQQAIRLESITSPAREDAESSVVQSS
ncbi:hypothetical protein JRO89_XS01G0167900 [Xanthoceras sorbifolium]|uniref:F-box domain-containing protein n=1 Tax=Xanthoceras sorbifolium TaxID=99658 RepID=A0ABQ8IK81_9ROSI|nr:hypothetical protein JRO89_XS01G0167900 [Xanthoceras sorbifolium]